MKNREIERLYRDGGDVIVLSSEDFTGRTLFKYRASSLNEESVLKLFNSIIEKYGLNLVVNIKPSKVIDVFKADEEFKW